MGLSKILLSYLQDSVTVNKNKIIKKHTHI
jgi:hypothetical protein